MGTLAAQMTDYVASGLKYAHEVATGEIVACVWVKLACQRHLDDLERFQGDDSPFYFDEDKANRVCDIIERFPHIKGEWARGGSTLELEPWQCFILIVVFGWQRTASDTRRFQMVYIEVARKNAKSTLTSAVGNYLMACDGEQGAHVVSAATTQKQAGFLFTDAQHMARRTEGFRKRFGVEVLAHVIIQQGTASKFEALSAEYSNLDGLNLHAALIDELHAHSQRGLWDVLETATGSRAQPLIWGITTAGLNRAGVCYNQRQHVIDVLKKTVPDESYFGIIYTLDDGDDPFAEENWPKANPNYGVSIYEDRLRDSAKRAEQMPSELNKFLNKHCNIWTNADTAWLPAGAWEKCADESLAIEDFLGERCFLGLDLAHRDDIAALAAVFPPTAERDTWVVFCYYYLPSETVQKPQNAHFQAWEEQKFIEETKGPVTNWTVIIDKIADFEARFDVAEIAFDPYEAGPFLSMIDTAGIRTPAFQIKQSAANMGPPMIELEGLVLSRKIRFDGDPVLSWMMSNVVCHRVGENMMQPRKESDEKKIDGVTATLLCINRAIRHDPLAGAFANGLCSV